MLKFLSLGSSSSGNCYLIYTETDAMFIDAGVGVRTLKKYFNQYGLSMSKVHNILITHDHADHIKSVGSLSNDYKLEVYSTQNVHAGIDRNYCVKKKIAAEHKHYIKTGEKFQVGEFTVTAWHVPHDSTDNVCYQVEHEGVVFSIMTDVGHVTDELKQVVASSDYLVIEANHDVEMLMRGNYPEYLKRRITCGTGHMNNSLCGQTILENARPRLKHVWLCHLSEENNHPDLALKTVQDILQKGGMKVDNGFVEVLRRKTPQGVYELK